MSLYSFITWHLQMDKWTIYETKYPNFKALKSKRSWWLLNTWIETIDKVKNNCVHINLHSDTFKKIYWRKIFNNLPQNKRFLGASSLHRHWRVLGGVLFELYEVAEVNTLFYHNREEKFLQNRFHMKNYDDDKIKLHIYTTLDCH